MAHFCFRPRDDTPIQSDHLFHYQQSESTIFSNQKNYQKKWTIQTVTAQAYIILYCAQNLNALSGLTASLCFSNKSTLTMLQLYYVTTFLAQKKNQRTIGPENAHLKPDPGVLSHHEMTLTLNTHTPLLNS